MVVVLAGESGGTPVGGQLTCVLKQLSIKTPIGQAERGSPFPPCLLSRIRI